MDYQEISIEYDMLKGSINRIFITDDLQEFPLLYESAKKRLDRIYNYHHERISQISVD